MKVIAKKNRELALINAQNTQNENKAETISLVVPEEYEDYNKKIVFITDDGNVWDVITNNEYKITNAITKYKQVDFYIWLTKEVDGESIDFRTKTKTLNFYHNEDASDEITDEEIHGVNTVVNLLEEEIEKVENLNIEATKIGSTTTVTITKKDGTTESVEITDGQNGQDGKDGEDGKDAKINGKNSIEIEAGNNITIDNTETGIRINSTNDGGTTDYTDLENKPKINNVELSGNKSLNDLGIQPKGNYIEDNNYVHTDNNFNNTYKNKLEGLENYDDTEIKADISDIQEEQVEQNTDIENLQTENTRLKATLPTTTGEGKEVTLNKTAELEFIKPPLPMGNSEQESREGYNLFNVNSIQPFNANCNVTITDNKLVYTNNNSYDVTITLFEGELNAGNIYGLVNSNLSREASIYKGNTYYNSLLTTSQKSNSVAINENGTYSIKTSCPSNGSITIDKLLISTINPNGKYEAYGATPSPEFESPITNVTGDVEVKIQNKNLNPYPYKDTTKTENGITFTDNGDGTINVNGTASSTTYFDMTSNGSTKGIKLKAGTYNVSIGASSNVRATIAKYSNASEVVAIIPINTSSTTFTIEEDTEITFVLAINNGLSANNILIKPQIEKGSTSSPYTPHKEQNLPLTLGNIELCKIGDYQDYFYKESNKWYLHKEIGKKVLNGSENYTLVSAEGYVKFTSNQLINNSVATGICISSHFHLGTNAIGAFKVYNNNWVDIFTEIMTLEEFKTWLSNNNVSMYYACTPTDTEITDTTLISQLEAINNALSDEEQTNISSNTIALFKVEAYQDAKVILAEKGTYSKPSTGIPKTDLASDVQTSLGKADTALQSHQDISGKANKISVVQTSASTIEINSNTFYKFGEVASLNITLASITDNTIYNEYMFEFVSGTTATTLTLPSSIKWLETPTIDANKIYQCSIVDNVGLLVGVANV